ncbi:MAG: hypothetical protein EOO09_13745 [Chitinophagaceae bacterium]|nr:MAG: hypothetical protein EOO09_13745 [Chitinophagaceae bacterium]
MNRYIAIIAFAFTLVSCQRDRFFEDEDDPGLSRLTSYSYDVCSAYVAGRPWVRPFFNVLRGEARVHLQLRPDAGIYDTLDIEFPGRFETEPLPGSVPWQSATTMTFAVPVAKGFTGEKFLAMAGQQFPAPNTQVLVSLHGEPGQGVVTGSGRLYLISIRRSQAAGQEFVCTGLFDGNIGDSILVTKGRFDYRIREDDHNLQ